MTKYTGPRVTVEFTMDGDDGVDVNIKFDPPLLPGMELPLTHKLALGTFKGTKLESMLDSAGLGGLS